MTRAVGASTKLYLLKEATYGTQASGNYHQLGFFSAEMGVSQPLEDVPVLGTGANRDPGDPFYGQIDSAGTIEIPVNLAGIGQWLRLLFGAPTTSGSSDYTHHFDSGAATLPSASIVLDYGSVITDRYGINLGVRADSITMNFAPAGAARAQIRLIGQGETRGATPGTGTPALLAGTNFNQFQGSISRNASALAQVTAATLTYSNGLEAIRTIRNDRKIESADPGVPSATGTITLRYANTTDALKDDAIAGTPCELDFAYIISATQRLTFNLPRVFIEDFKTPISGPNGIEVQAAFRAAYDATDTRMLRATLLNQTASYA
jgi:hypothetical protein